MGDLDKLNDLMDDIKLSLKLYEEDRITEAYFLLQNIEKYAQELHPDLAAAVQRELTQSENIVNLRMEGSRNADLMNQFEDDSQWNDWTNGVGMNQDVVVGIHKDEERGQYYFKIEGRVECSMLPTLAALLENDLYRLWMPLCDSSKTLAKMSPYRRAVKCEMDFALIRKDASFSAHGDILPDGGVLLTMHPLTQEEEHKFVKKADWIPASERLDISGGFLLYEEAEDLTISSSDAAAEYEAHQRRISKTSSMFASQSIYGNPGLASASLESTAGGGASPRSAGVRTPRASVHTGTVLRSGNGGRGMQSGGGGLGVGGGAGVVSMAADTTYNDRMLVLSKKNQQNKYKTNVAVSQTSATLDRYKLPIHELYEVAPSGSSSSAAAAAGSSLSGSGGLRAKKTTTFAADNPLPGAAAASTTAGTAAAGAAGGAKQKGGSAQSGLAGGLGLGAMLGIPQMGASANAAAEEDRKVTYVRGIFKMDPKLNFMPDWIFNMAVRSSAAMVIPMLEYQAKLFADPAGSHHHLLEEGKLVYKEIEKRLEELKQRKEGKNKKRGGGAGDKVKGSSKQMQ